MIPTVIFLVLAFSHWELYRRGYLNSTPAEMWSLQQSHFTLQNEKVHDYSRNNKLQLIIGCNANAHHICWGSSNINERGRALLKNLVTTDLDILNKGAKPTFIVSNRPCN